MHIPKNRPKINNELRKAIYRKDHGHCHYCGCRLGKHTFKADHVKPFSKGGLTNYENLTATCTLCNSVKSNLDINRFRDRLVDYAKNNKEVGKKIRNKYSLDDNNMAIEFYFEREAQQCMTYC